MQPLCYKSLVWLEQCLSKEVQLKQSLEDWEAFQSDLERYERDSWKRETGRERSLWKGTKSDRKGGER